MFTGSIAPKLRGAEDDRAAQRGKGSSTRQLAGKQAALTLIYISRNTAAREGERRGGGEKRERRKGEHRIMGCTECEVYQQPVRGGEESGAEKVEKNGDTEGKKAREVFLVLVLTMQNRRIQQLPKKTERRTSDKGKRSVCKMGVKKKGVKEEENIPRGVWPECLVGKMPKQ